MIDKEYTSYLHFTTSIIRIQSQEDKIEFSCIICKPAQKEGKFKASIGRTSNIKKHLENFHGSILGKWFKAYDAFNNLKKSSRKIDEDTLHLVKWFISSNSAIESLKNPDLRAILKPKIHSSKTFRESTIPAVIEKLEDAITEKLQDAIVITAIADIWTSPEMLDFLAVGVVLTTSTLEKEIFVIGMVRMTGRHNSENIKTAIETILNKFEFDKSKLNGK